MPAVVDAGSERIQKGMTDDGLRLPAEVDLQADDSSRAEMCMEERRRVWTSAYPAKQNRGGMGLPGR